MIWKCPKCKREFAQKNQRHYCTNISPSYHFKGKSESIRNLFKTFQEKLNEQVPVRYDAISFAINMKSRRHMGMLFIKKDKIKVEFFLPHLVNHSRIVKSAGLNGRYTHIVEISKEADIDSQLISWLKQAFEFNS